MKKAKTEAGKKEGVNVTLLEQWIAEHYRTPEDNFGKEGLRLSSWAVRVRSPPWRWQCSTADCLKAAS